jgi:hypothetical protein
VECENKVIPAIAGRLEPSESDAQNTWATYRKARNWGTAANSHIWRCTQTAESANVKVQSV